jgi:hypothetical protein
MPSRPLRWAARGLLIAAFVGTALLVGVVTVAVTLPILAEADPRLVAPEGPLFTDPAIRAVFVTTLITLLLGYVDFGVATVRAGFLPTGVGLIVGTVFHAGGEFGFPWPLVVLGGIIFSLASVWLGWSLSKTKRVGIQRESFVRMIDGPSGEVARPKGSSDFGG